MLKNKAIRNGNIKHLWVLINLLKQSLGGIVL